MTVPTVNGLPTPAITVHFCGKCDKRARQTDSGVYFCPDQYCDGQPVARPYVPLGALRIMRQERDFLLKRLDHLEKSA